MKRKIFYLALVLLLAIFFSCSKTESPSTPTKGTPVLSDVVNWTQVTVTSPFTAADWNTALVYNNKMWLIGGRDGSGNTIAEVWSSTNGADWTLVTGNAAFGPRFRHASVVFNNKMWVIGGTPISGECVTPLNDVWSSTNGADWVLVTGNAEFTARFSFNLYSFAGKLWVMCGMTAGCSYADDVWSSSDGITWTQVTAAQEFLQRNSSPSLVFDNKMWLIGGGRNVNESYYGENYYWGDNDVWSSSNGVDWECLTGNAGFLPRTAHAAFTVDGKIFVSSGAVWADSGGQIYDDLWYSTDGKFWTLVTWNLTGTPRMRARALVYDGKVWLLGGSNCQGHCPTNEVWYAD
jgi:hypothetical protein